MDRLYAAVDRIAEGDLDGGLDECGRLLPMVDEETRLGWVDSLGLDSAREKLMLGLVFRSLDRLESAIELFQDVRKDATFALAGMVLLGEAFLMLIAQRHSAEAGLIAGRAVALKWYERALTLEGCPEEAYRLPKFAMAVILAQSGKTEESRRLLTELGDYRDAPRWLAGLDDDEPPPGAAMALDVS